MALLEARDMHKRFGDRVVLEDISFAFEPGELHGIMGPNGAGKTTCFNVLTGRFKPDRGRCVFDGRDITGLAAARIAARWHRALVPDHEPVRRVHALENVEVALPEFRAPVRRHPRPARRRRERARRRRARAVLAEVGLAGKGSRRRGPVLWRSPRARDRRRARAAPARPVPRRADLGPRLRRHGAPRRPDRGLKRRLTIVVIEHDMGFLFGLADRISVIHWGQVIAEGTPADAARRTRAGRAPRTSAACRGAVGRAHRHLLRRDAGAVRRLARRGARARSFALLGPNGAGKTTTLRSILGLTRRARRDPLRRPDVTHADAPHRARRHRLGARRPPRVPDAHRGAQPLDRRRRRAFAPGA